MQLKFAIKMQIRCRVILINMRDEYTKKENERKANGIPAVDETEVMSITDCAFEMIISSKKNMERSQTNLSE